MESKIQEAQIQVLFDELKSARVVEESDKDQINQRFIMERGPSNLRIIRRKVIYS